jgi:protein Xni
MTASYLIIDGLNLFTRHFVANPSTSENGEAIGGIVGTLYSISRLCEKFKPERVVVVWEGGGSTRKRQIYPEYKMGRRPQRLNRYYGDDIPDTVQSRNKQVSLLILALNNLPVCQIYTPECEADDVIGYLCKYKLAGNKKVIVSSDKDFYQLLDKKTLIYSPTWKKFVSFNEVKNKFGISAENFCLAKSICGDSSDNISGVKGAGFKTIAKRFPFLSSEKFFLISDIMSECRRQIENGSRVKIYSEILKSENVIRRNWKLINLDTGNLSVNQIKRILNTVDTFAAKRNKMSVLKIFQDESIKNIDIDRIFLTMKMLS